MLGMKVWNFKVHLSSPSNGIIAYLEMDEQGKAAQTVSKKMPDRGMLE